MSVKLIKIEDVWDKWSYQFPFSIFGLGSLHKFSWYLEGDSPVAVSSIEDICRWLQGCQYVSDEKLFNEKDFWQHPRTFEQLRKGDCEDHAFWAWRKMSELGLDAEFYVGEWAPEGNKAGGMLGLYIIHPAV